MCAAAGIPTLFLEFVGADLVYQTYAPSFLVEVNDGTFPFGINHLHGLVELGAAVASL